MNSQTRLIEEPVDDKADDTPALCVVGSSDVTLWSLSPGERLRRQFARAGISQVISEDSAVRWQGPVVIVRNGAVLDQPLVPILAETAQLALKTSYGNESSVLACHARSGGVADGLALIKGQSSQPSGTFNIHTPATLGAGFWKALRKRETPYALLSTPETHADVEWRMFMGTYKGATDLVTKHVWPVPAFYATRWLAALGASPNMVTTVAAIATVLAFYFFLQGQFALGLAAAWLMTFLDTVDGKLARTTLTSSKWGDIFDHGIDLIHPPFWYVAWAIGLTSAGFLLSGPAFWWLMAVIIGGYVLQRLMEGAAIKWLGLEIHIWRRIDTLFRQITARRNPNLVILTVFTLFGRPDAGLVAVAWWTAICLVLHGLQLGQAFVARKKSGQGSLQSWMSQP